MTSTPPSGRPHATGVTGLEVLERLAEPLSALDLGAEARLRLDLVTARGPIVAGIPVLFSLSIVPGLDGVALEADETRWLLPHELLEENLLTAFRPFPYADLRFGVDRDTALVRLTSGHSPGRDGALVRFRTASFVEDGEGGVTPLHRNAPPRQALTREAVSRAVVLAGDYVLAHQNDSGGFIYFYEPYEDAQSSSGSAWARHAGTTVFLLHAYEQSRQRRFLIAAEQALDRLWEQVEYPCSGRYETACVLEGNASSLGANAIATIAYLTHHHLAAESNSLARARALGAHILTMQRGDGEFYHRYWTRGVIDETLQSFYYTGEAAYALAMLAGADPTEPAWRGALRATLDYWTGPYWNHFAGGFFFAEEHWACLALEAAGEVFDEPRYDNYAYDIAHHYADLILDERAAAFPDFVGGVGFGAIFPPHTTSTSARTEAMVGAYRLSVARGQPDERLADAIRTSYGFLLAAQYTDAYAPLLPNMDLARGGFRESAITPGIRIDYTQHAGSALARGVDFVMGGP